MQAQVAGHTAALDIAKVAAIELPTGQWSDLIQKLLDNMEAEPAKSALRQSTLEALGYICEELGSIEQDVLEQAQVRLVSLQRLQYCIAVSVDQHILSGCERTVSLLRSCAFSTCMPGRTATTLLQPANLLPKAIWNACSTVCSIRCAACTLVGALRLQPDA